MNQHSFSRDCFLLLDERETVVALVHFDPEDFDKVYQCHWHVAERGNKRYAITNGNKNLGIPRTYMHRFIMDAPKGTEIDHINSNPLDNRRCNLRICNRQLNSFNIPSHKDSRSKFKGIYLHKHSNTWTARISKDRKVYSLGYYKTEIDAALAYNQKAKELFGEYAYLNVVEGVSNG